MTAGQAKTVEWLIILLCVGSIAMIFQPFSLTLFSIGCVTVIVGALAFNLVPFCRPGVPFATLGRVVVTILIILAIAAVLGVLTAQAYVWYLATLR